MARKRQIDPGIWTSEQFINLKDPWAKLLFIGMFSNADDEGRMKASLTHLKAVIFPGDPHTLEQMKQWRDMVEEQQLCHIYNVNGTEYIWLPTFGTHQYISKPYPSRIPTPFPNCSDTLPAPFFNRSLTVPRLNGIDNGIDNESGEVGGEVSTFFYGNGLGIETEKSIVIESGEVVAVVLAWKRALDDLRSRVTKSNFQSWLKGSMAIGVKDSRFILAVNNEYTRDSVIGRIKHVVEKALNNVTGRFFSLDVIVLNDDPMRVYVRETIELICEEHGVSKVELLRGRRTSEVVDARRQIAKHLTDTTNLPLLQIARQLGQGAARRGKGAWDF